MNDRKPNKSASGSEADSRLRQSLLEWRIDEPLPPRFTERVWQRIARRESQAPASEFAYWMTWARQFFRRPALAAGYITVLLLAGLLMGYRQARVENERASEQLSARYVKLMDPYQR